MGIKNRRMSEPPPLLKRSPIISSKLATEVSDDAVLSNGGLTCDNPPLIECEGEGDVECEDHCEPSMPFETTL